ncbi:hypothetical protein AB0M47_04770 [Hamadaea sp. NPDC051192]|uniref:hypothetical protein n=1 Tax=Hamadaea sp. NPDC051192 TaxID=3154940 RepID=UPI003449FC2A
MTLAPDTSIDHTPAVAEDHPDGQLVADDLSTVELAGTYFQLERLHEGIRHLLELLSRAITILLTVDLLILGYGVGSNKGALILGAGLTPLVIWAAIRNTGRRARPLLELAIACEDALPVQVPRVAIAVFPLVIATRPPRATRLRHTILDLITTRQITIYLLLASAGQLAMFAIAALRYHYPFL